MPKVMRAPDGSRIVGTNDTLIATATFSREATRKELEDRDFPYSGETEVSWESQETTTDENDQLQFVSETGDILTLNQLVEVEIPDKE